MMILLWRMLKLTFPRTIALLLQAPRRLWTEMMILPLLAIRVARDRAPLVTAPVFSCDAAVADDVGPS